MSDIFTLLIGASLSSLFASLVSLIPVLWMLTGFQLFTIRDDKVITSIQKNIAYSTILNEQNESSGWFTCNLFPLFSSLLCSVLYSFLLSFATSLLIGEGISYVNPSDVFKLFCCLVLCDMFSIYSCLGNFMCGYISSTHTKDSSSTVLHIVCTHRKFNKISKLKVVPNASVKRGINVLIRLGPVWYIRYETIYRDCSGLWANANQEEIISEILTCVELQKRCTIILSGKPGVGKSCMGALIALNLNGTFCDTFDPTFPNDYFIRLYNKIGPTKEKPLVVSLDEFDQIIDKCHNNSIFRHKHVPSEITDMASWNKFFDHFDWGLYPHVIFILTTNLNKSQIEKRYGEACIRKGRIDLYRTLGLVETLKYIAEE